MIYAENIDSNLDYLIETQDNIIQQIVGVIQDKINLDILSLSYKKNPVDRAAYENYLIGLNILQKGTVYDDKKAKAYFEKALEVEPKYSLAYTGLSLSYFNFWSCSLWDRWDESMKGAHENALKAIEYDQNDYIALGVLGRTYTYLREYEKAEHYLRKSLRMNSNDASHLHRVAYSFVFLGYADESVELYKKSIKINPFHDDKYFAYGSNYYLESGDFVKSIELSKKTSSDCYTDFPVWVAAAYYKMGDMNNMWISWQQYIEQFKTKAFSGKKDVHEAALDWLEVINPFQKDNYVFELRDFVRTSTHHIPLQPIETNKHKTSNYIQKKEDHWELCFNNQSILLKNSKGLNDIYVLMQEPYKDFYCLDLMQGNKHKQADIEIIDEKARKAYFTRIKELQTEIEAAESNNQLEYISKLHKEYDQIMQYLSGSIGIGGKIRKVGSNIDKARSAVTWKNQKQHKKNNASPQRIRKTPVKFHQNRHLLLLLS